jgi:hypothetical protein
LRKRIRYGLLAILLFGGLYFALRFYFGFFTPYNYWTAREHIKNGEFIIVEIGEKPLHFEEKQELANTYGFMFLLPGCKTSPDYINGAKYFNNVMIDHLEWKYGKGWWTQFQAQLDSIDITMENEPGRAGGRRQ